jgi:hypothetical protein
MRAGNRKGYPMYKLFGIALVLAAFLTLLFEAPRAAGKSNQPVSLIEERLDNIQHVKDGNYHGIFHFTVYNPDTKEVTIRYIDLFKSRRYKIFVDVPEDQPMYLVIWRDPTNFRPKNIQRAEIHVRCSTKLAETKDLRLSCPNSP